MVILMNVLLFVGYMVSDVYSTMSNLNDDTQTTLDNMDQMYAYLTNMTTTSNSMFVEMTEVIYGIMNLDTLMVAVVRNTYIVCHNSHHFTYLTDVRCNVIAKHILLRIQRNSAANAFF